MELTRGLCHGACVTRSSWPYRWLRRSRVDLHTATRFTSAGTRSSESTPPNKPFCTRFMTSTKMMRSLRTSFAISSRWSPACRKPLPTWNKSMSSSPIDRAIISNSTTMTNLVRWGQIKMRQPWNGTLKKRSYCRSMRPASQKCLS